MKRKEGIILNENNILIRHLTLKEIEESGDKYH